MPAASEGAGSDKEKAEYIERWRVQLTRMLWHFGNQNQSWLVEKTGIDQTTVSRWFTGSRGPNIRQLEKVARAFGLTLAQLLEWSPNNAGPELAPNEEPMIAREKIPARVESFLASRTNWLSEYERQALIGAVIGLSNSPRLDLTDEFLQRLANAIKFGYLVSGTD